jgi:hypothetical protein
MLLMLMPVGCQKPGHAPTEQELGGIGTGMTLREVESKLGAGRDITRTGPQDTNAVLPVWPSRRPSDKIMQWGKGDRVFFVRFENGRVAETMAFNPRPADIPGVTPEQREVDQERKTRMHWVASYLRFAKNDDGRLPPAFTPAPDRDQFIPEEYLRDIRQGKVIVRWGRELTDPLLAYEAEVPDKGGWIVSRGESTEVSAAEYARLLASSP